MRILTVGNMYPPHHLGGYELVWQSAVEHLRQGGHEVRVLTTDHREEGRDSPGEADVHRELAWYWKDHGFPRMTLRQRLALERQNARTLERHLGQFRPMAVAWWAMGGMSLSLIERVRRAGLAAAGFVCDDWMVYGPRTDGWMRAFGHPVLASVAERISGIPTRLDLASAARWVFPSETVRRRAAQAWELRETAVVHQGVDHSLFRPAPRPDWAWRLLYVGRLDPRKGLELAIRGLSEMPEGTSLTIVGEGDAAFRAALEQLAEREGLAAQVRFLSQAAREELPGLYAAADAVVFPVLWEEPWGLVPLEAMAVGVPVVATGRGGSGEYLRDRQNCLLFDPDGGALPLARALRELADQPALRDRIREGGFKTTNSMDRSDFDRAAERNLREVLDARGVGGAAA